jgi:hypothetical protein
VGIGVSTLPGCNDKLLTIDRYVFNGIVAHYKASTPGRSSGMWGEAVRLLEGKTTPPTGMCFY